MKISVIIPVWNGATVLAACLNALKKYSNPEQTEIICVDNASADDSAALVRTQHPDVQLISQPVNLGFAGGVNAGMAAANGELFVLLNQDCLVSSGWLESLRATFAANPTCGIAGAVLEDDAGAINHAGALITRPLGYGEHIQKPPTQDTAVDYVTGAIFAISRPVWERIGGMDEDFYPAYYEESDYCYRARRHGFETFLSAGAHGRHLFSSRAWQRDPIRHTANQHQSRYRFICKQFVDRELLAFVEAETSAAAHETSFHEALGRVLAASYTLDHLDEILHRRHTDGNNALSPAFRRVLAVGFTDIYRTALHRTEQLALPQPVEGAPANDFATWQAQSAMLHQEIQQLHMRMTTQWQVIDELYTKITGHGIGATPHSSLQNRLRQAYHIATGQHIALLVNVVHELSQHQELLQALEHRMNLLETQLTLQEYRRQLHDQLVIYAHR